MYTDKLIALVSPPNKLDVESITENIKLVEEHYNIKYPDDYIEFVTKYGIGQFIDYISIYVPINSEAYYKEKEDICLNYKKFRTKFPNEYTHNIFPEDNGLLPLGVTDDGSEIWWKTNKEKEKWTIVVYDENSWDYEEYQMQVCEFLYKFL